MINNKITVEKDSVHLVFEGDQEISTFRLMLEQSLEAIKSHNNYNNGLAVWVDVRNLGRLNTNIRKFGFRSMGDITTEKILIVGLCKVRKYMVSLLSAASGKSENIKCFDDFHAAKQWLSISNPSGRVGN